MNPVALNHVCQFAPYQPGEAIGKWRSRRSSTSGSLGDAVFSDATEAGCIYSLIDHWDRGKRTAPPPVLNRIELSCDWREIAKIAVIAKIERQRQRHSWPNSTRVRRA